MSKSSPNTDISISNLCKTAFDFANRPMGGLNTETIDGLKDQFKTELTDVTNKLTTANTQLNEVNSNFNQTQDKLYGTRHLLMAEFDAEFNETKKTDATAVKNPKDFKQYPTSDLFAKYNSDVVGTKNTLIELINRYKTDTNLKIDTLKEYQNPDNSLKTVFVNLKPETTTVKLVGMLKEILYAQGKKNEELRQENGELKDQLKIAAEAAQKQEETAKQEALQAAEKAKQEALQAAALQEAEKAKQEAEAANEKTIEGLTQQITKLTEQTEQLNMQKSLFETNISELETQLTNAKGDAQLLQEKMTAIEEKDKANKLKDMQNADSETSREMEPQRQQIDELNQKKQTDVFEANIRDLADQLKTGTDTIAEKQLEIDALQTQINEQQTQPNSNTNETGSQTDDTDLQSKLGELQSENNNLNTKQAELVTQIEQLKQTITTLESEIIHLESQLEAKKTEIEKSKESADAKPAELEKEIKTVTSLDGRKIVAYNDFTYYLEDSDSDFHKFTELRSGDLDPIQITMSKKKPYEIHINDHKIEYREDLTPLYQPYNLNPPAVKFLATILKSIVGITDPPTPK